jgi:HK97 family phage prohead protease
MPNEINIETIYDIAKGYEDEGEFYIEGFAATDAVDVERDMISEKALKQAAEVLNTKRKTLLFNHDGNKPVGKIIKAEYKEQDGIKGIWIKALVSKAVEHIRQMIKEGVLNKFSIRGMSGQDVKQAYSNILDNTINVVQSLIPVEVSLCSVPVNPECELRWYQLKKAVDLEFKGGEEDMTVAIDKSALDKLTTGLKDLTSQFTSLFKAKTDADEEDVKKADVKEEQEEQKEDEVVKADDDTKAEEAPIDSKAIEAITGQSGDIVKSLEELQTGEAFDKSEGDELKSTVSAMNDTITGLNETVTQVQKSLETFTDTYETKVGEIDEILSGLSSVSKSIVDGDTKVTKKEDDKPAYAGSIFGSAE